MIFLSKPDLLQFIKHFNEQRAQLTALNVPDYLFEEQWDFKLINALDAWEKLQNDPQRAAKGNTAFGNPEVIIAVCNDGTDITHPDLNGLLSNGAPKIVQVYDFSHMAANMNHPESSKGTACSSAAIAFANTTEGMTGIAGNSRLMAIQKDPSFAKDAAMFAWIAGFDPGNAAFPPLPPGAAIISNSWSRPGEVIENNVAVVLNNITTYGRQGKGTLLFFEAGDNGLFYDTFSSYATHPRAIAISASTLDQAGIHEIFASYSNLGAGIQFCAPSSERITRDPSPVYGAVVATHRPGAPNPIARTTIVQAPGPLPQSNIRVTDVTPFFVSDQVIIGDMASPDAERFEIIQIDPGLKVLVLNRPWVRVPVTGDQVTMVDGNCPGNGSVNARLTAFPVSGRSIQVNNAALFTAAKAVMINPDTPFAEAHAINRVDRTTGTVYLMTDLLHPSNCVIDTRVDVGPADYKNNHNGGTSYATPVCAGIAALCLAANKNLSWVEVRHLMRSTACKINIAETGRFIQSGDPIPFGKWRDIEGKDIVSDSGTLIIPPNQHPAIIVAINANRDVLELDSVSGFKTGQAVAISSNARTDLRVVIRITGNSIVLDAPVFHSFMPGHLAQSGLAPHYSAFYGYGRVDAGKAVQAALDSVTNYRQLVIRNNLSDNGTASSTDIQSPDIWVTNEVLMAVDYSFTLQKTVVGLDDLTHPSTYSGSQNAVFYIEIDGNVLGIDTFRWTYNGEVHEGEPITGAKQVLAEDFAIQFGSISGHTKRDNWTIYIDRIESPLDYTKEGPHENPKRLKDRFIHARIKNMVTGSLAKQYTNLDCWVRFFMVLCDGKTANALAQGAGFDSNFYFSSTGKNNDWDDTRSISTISNGDHGTYFLGEMAIPEGAIAPSDPSGMEKGTHIVSIPWKLSDVPPAEFEQSVFLMVHLAPFHGPLNGAGAHNNSCLSYREIAFIQFEFKEEISTLLSQQLKVDAFGLLKSQVFRVDIKSEAGHFTTEKLQLECVRINDNGTEERAIFHHDGTAWVFMAANPAWAGLQVNAPVILVGTESLPAAGAEKRVIFQGEFQAAKEHQRIILRAQLISRHSTAVIANKEITVDIIQDDEVPIGINDENLSSPPPPHSHAFADMTLLSQNADRCFGPVSGQESNSFQVTSLFTNNIDTNAYAITDGILFLQPGADADTVNLVLKPLKQPVIGFTPVKYFIYRSLCKADFLDPSDESKVLAAHDSNSVFIKRQRTIFSAQNATGANFLSKALGYDPTHQPADSILDSYFFKTDPGFQLPLVTKGMQLGRFLHDGNKAFGLDIMLEEGTFTTTLAYVRKKSHIITVSGMSTTTDAARMLKKLRQEEILNFLDPAAFYGMHIAQGGIVETKNIAGETAGNKGQAIYSKVVDKFHTRNKVYLDIRSENSNSYNFYGNYKGAAGAPDFNKNIQLGLVSTLLVPQLYQTHGWPLIIDDRPAQPVTSDTSQMFCSLRFDDNKTPILYVETGTISGTIAPSSASAFIDSSELGDATASWTSPIGFVIPNTGPSGAKLNMATIIKLFYGRTEKANPWPDTVLKTESPTDNVFGPLDLSPLWKSEKRIKWITAQDKKYVHFTDHGYMAERGVALDGFIEGNMDAGRVIFFGVASDYYKGPLVKQIHGITGGVSTKGTFFEAAGFLQHQKLSFDPLIISGTRITTLTLSPASDHALPSSAILLLCVSRKELDALKAISGFHPAYPRYAREELVEEGIDTDGRPYSKYRLKVQGLDTNGKYKLAAPAGDIFVYSIDKFLYFSDAYSKDEPVPTTYQRNAEESIGILVDPGTGIPREDHFISKDKLGVIAGVSDSAANLVFGFAANVRDTPNNDEVRAELGRLILQYAVNLLKRMRGFAALNNNSNADDRILYWTRIKMKVALQSHELLLQSFEERNILLNLFESVTRGYADADFTPAIIEHCKKVLVIGFDPYFLHPNNGSAHNIFNSNPSGAAALALHNQFVLRSTKKVAYIQSVILPARYADLDKKGGPGIVEEIFNRFIDPDDLHYQPVDAIIVMDKYLPGSFMFDRFSARSRGAQKDNNFQHSASIPPVIAGNEFYESTLPVESSLTGLKFERFFNQTYEYRIKANRTIKKFTNAKRDNTEKIGNDPTGNDPGNLLPVNQPSADIKAIKGAVDSYFANEVFYRLCVMQEKKNKAVKMGLLSLPRLQGTAAEAAGSKKVKKDFDPVLTKEVIDEVRDIISTMAAFDL